MGNWTNPTTSSLYTDFITELKDRDNDCATMFAGSPTNVPNNTIRWNNTSKIWEKYNGATWDPLAVKYLIDVDTVDGLHSTNITQNAFKTISVSGQSDIVADDPSDTLTVVGGTSLTVTTTPSTDTLSFTLNRGTASNQVAIGNHVHTGVYEPVITALALNKGGTGQTTKTPAFDALSPTSLKGDIIVDNGTNAIKLAVGTNEQVLIADSTQASGLRWGANGIPPAASIVRSMLNTATVSLSGTVTEITEVSILLSPYSFFPMIHTSTATYGSNKGTIRGNLTDGASPDAPRFSLAAPGKGESYTYDVDYRYIVA